MSHRPTGLFSSAKSALESLDTYALDQDKVWRQASKELETDSTGLTKETHRSRDSSVQPGADIRG